MSFWEGKDSETSGMFQHVQCILIDDDQDCVILEVTLTPPTIGGPEASCHVGYRSCFYCKILVKPQPGTPIKLRFTETARS